MFCINVFISDSEYISPHFQNSFQLKDFFYSILTLSFLWFYKNIYRMLPVFFIFYYYYLFGLKGFLVG